MEFPKALKRDYFVSDQSDVETQIVKSWKYIVIQHLIIKRKLQIYIMPVTTKLIVRNVRESESGNVRTS